MAPPVPRKQHAAAAAEYMKWIALAALVIQNTALVLLMRSSLTAPGEHYIVTTAVACMEGVKVATCLVVEGWGFPTLGAYMAHLKRELGKPRDLVMLAVPSLLYTLQNNLLYIALANLDAAIYQVCYQLKILTTALFSVLLLKRTLSRAKWAALVILTVGVSLAELDAKAGQAHRAAAMAHQNPMLGFLCVLMACVTSGFAGVWFEKILKGVGAGNSNTNSSSSTTKASASTAAGTGPDAAPAATPSSSVGGGAAAAGGSGAPPPQSMWIRNIQMGLTSVVLALLAVYSKDRAVVAEKGFFYGYNQAVVGVILLQALGGLVVAAVVKYADNILKGFGSGISIVISCTLEWLFFDFHPTLRFIFGASLVNVALYCYQNDALFKSAGGLVGGGAGGGGLLPLHHLHHHHHHHHHHHGQSDSGAEADDDEAEARASLLLSGGEGGGGGLGAMLPLKVLEGPSGTLTARSSISASATSPTAAAMLGDWRQANSKSRDMKSLV